MNVVTCFSGSKMSCNGCRVLRKGCSDRCVLRQCLKWIESAEAQAHATLFVTKFFGRAGLTAFINGVSESQRPALFQSLLYEACGRYVNPVYGAVGLLYSGKWNICQTAVETVLKGGTPEPVRLADAKQNYPQSSFNTSSFQTCLSSMAPPSVESLVTSSFADDRLLRGPTIDYSNSNEGETKAQVMQPLKRKWICNSSYDSPNGKKVRSSENEMLEGRLDSCGEIISRVNSTPPGLTSENNLSVTGYESGRVTATGKVDLVHAVTAAAHNSSAQAYDHETMGKVDSGRQSEPLINQEHCISVSGPMQVSGKSVKPCQTNVGAALRMRVAERLDNNNNNACCFDASVKYHDDGRNTTKNTGIELDLSLKAHTFPYICQSEKRLESINLGISSPGSVNSEGSVTGLQSERTSHHTSKQEFKFLQLL